jgi:hypothetical protein
VPASAPRGRRSQYLRLLAVAAIFYVAFPFSAAFFLGPLAVLLVLSRPATLREWIWIAVCVAAVVIWLRLPESLSQQTIRAAAAFYVGALAALTLGGKRSLVSRALLAVAIAVVATIGWFLVLHLRFVDLQNDLVAQTWADWRQIATNLPATPPTGSGDFVQDAQATDLPTLLATSLTTLKLLFPALLALMALGGTWLAWDNYQRIARAPLAPAASPLREFRFNDHLVWALLLAAAVMLLHLSPALTIVGSNVLVVIIALYCLRGMAIVAMMMRNAPPLFIALLVVIMFLTLAFVLVGFVLVGIADTWLDFRRRAAPPSGVRS